MTAREIDGLFALANRADYAELVKQARDLLERDPSTGTVWKILGIALWSQGEDAREALRRATTLLPVDAEAHSNYGHVLAEAGQFDHAAQSCRRALQINPDFAEAHNNLGNALRGLGRCADAVASYGKAVTVQPAFTSAHNNLGAALLQLGQLREAAAEYRQVTSLAPDCAEAHRALGKVLLQLWQLPEAIVSARRAVQLKPGWPEAHNNLGNALLDSGLADEAEASYRRALALNPVFAEALSNLGFALRRQGRAADAEAACRRALEINPELVEAVLVLAELSADQGEFDTSEALFRRAAALDPQRPGALAAIARLRKMTADDEQWFSAMRRHLVEPLLPVRAEVDVHYAIGKYFDDTRDFPQAFDHYQRANELTKRHRPLFDCGQLTRNVDDIIAYDHSAWSIGLPAHRNDSSRPVFIVGMPRSGTTLVEHILAAHPAVFGAGELPFWSVASARAETTPIGGLAEEYLALLRTLSSDASWVIDKMPGNFWYLGLIHAALPNARIVHMQRNPIDVCLSIYCKDFSVDHGYANDLNDLAHYYTEYHRLMNHWRERLPPATMLDVPYEALIEDQEGWSRRLLDFIGLPWDPCCLNFQRTRRAVMTSSRWQVRQKINKSSIGRWHDYAPWLGPLLRLEDLGTESPTPGRR